jgi:hypothetical protein
VNYRAPPPNPGNYRVTAALRVTAFRVTVKSILYRNRPGRRDLDALFCTRIRPNLPIHEPIDCITNNLSVTASHVTALRVTAKSAIQVAESWIKGR